MTDHHCPRPGQPFTSSQLARLDYARRDLEYARSEDLADLEAAALILLIERLRMRLDDVLQVINELTCRQRLQAQKDD